MVWIGVAPAQAAQTEAGRQNQALPSPGDSPRDQILQGKDPALPLCHHGEDVDEGKKNTGLKLGMLGRMCATAAGLQPSGQLGPTVKCPTRRGRLGKAYLLFLALLLHGGGLCVFLDV